MGIYFVAFQMWDDLVGKILTYDSIILHSMNSLGQDVFISGYYLITIIWMSYF